LLTDPELVKHLGKLLQAYREAPPDKREEALMVAMREVKGKAAQETATTANHGSSGAELRELSISAIEAPPFEPDIFTPSWGQDRRQYPRLKCYVAVELRIDGLEAPIWGNLSNTSRGGCFVETVTPVRSGVGVEIGLWVASGKIWVKGLVINGTVTQSNPSFGVRIRFADIPSPERETLREFLKFVEGTTKGYQVENGYLARLKR
jgi:hypothetical protein